MKQVVYMIIFLNGASSSGKSTIAKNLQAILDDRYLHIGIDTFIGLMPEQSNQLACTAVVADGFYWQPVTLHGKTRYRIAKGNYGKQVNNAYRTTVAHLANCGLNVIVDDVCDGDNEMQIWRTVLQNYDCLLVGVFCDNDVLEQREQARGDRQRGTAIEQSARVHQGIKYDLIIDTTLHSAAQCALMIKQKLDIK